MSPAPVPPTLLDLDQLLAAATMSGGEPFSRELAQLLGQDGAFVPPDRQLRERAETVDPHLLTRLGELTDAVAAAVTKQRRSAKLRPNVELLALNLYSVWQENPWAVLKLPMDRNWYSAPVPRNPDLTFNVTVRQAWRGLMQLGMAELVRTGSEWGGFSWVRATQRLAEFLDGGAGPARASLIRLARHYDPIVLKTRRSDANAKERPVPFKDTRETSAMRVALERINAVNDPSRIRLPLLDETEAQALWDSLHGIALNDEQGIPASPAGIEIWFAQTWLHRVFNRGRFDHGGRFYGASWQSLGKEWRRRILIDDQPVTEMDFGSLHPRLAHHLDGAEAPEDCYVGIHPDRALAKRAVAALLNAENGTTHPPRWFSVGKAGMPWSALVARAAETLPCTAKHFGTGIGLRLQRLDSDIAEDVMLHFAGGGRPCLGVHDSFLVAQEHGSELAEVMRQAYRKRVGWEPVIKAS